MRKAFVSTVLVAAIAACIAGCGGNSSEDATAPQPGEPIETRMEELNRVIAADECEGAAKITFSILRPVGEPDAPATKEECKFLGTPDSFLQALSGVEFDRAAEYGTAALTEADPPAGESVDALVAFWALDVDDEYRFVALTGGDSQIGRSLPKGNDAQEKAEAFVRSVAKGHCDPDLINPDGTLAQGDSKLACDELDKGELLAPALKSDPDATLEPMGETLDWAFYGLPTEAGYFTLALNSLPNEAEGQSTEYGVYDVLPAGEVEALESDGGKG